MFVIIVYSERKKKLPREDPETKTPYGKINSP
jgi:hypothetical protein